MYILSNINVILYNIWLKWEKIYISYLNKRLNNLIEIIFIKKLNGNGINKIIADLNKLNNQISQIDKI